MQTETRKYISKQHASRILQCTPDAVPKIAAAAGVHVSQLPGHPWVRYDYHDITQVAAKSRQLATA